MMLYMLSSKEKWIKPYLCYTNAMTVVQLAELSCTISYYYVVIGGHPYHCIFDHIGRNFLRKCL